MQDKRWITDLSLMNPVQAKFTFLDDIKSFQNSRSFFSDSRDLTRAVHKEERIKLRIMTSRFTKSSLRAKEGINVKWKHEMFHKSYQTISHTLSIAQKCPTNLVWCQVGLGICRCLWHWHLTSKDVLWFPDSASSSPRISRTSEKVSEDADWDTQL